MPTREQITDAIDARAAALLPGLQARQAAYLAAHGRYFQGLLTHSTLPADGAAIGPDRLAVRPGDQAESWLDVGFDTSGMHAAIRIDPYLSSGGPGYVLRLQVKIDGVRWRRSRNVGPETYFEEPWNAVGEDA